MSRSRSSKKRKIVDEDKLSSDESETPEYNVEEIMSHNGNPSKLSTLYFEVHWEGWDGSNTWEPYKNVCDCVAFEEYVAKTPSLAAVLAPKTKRAKKETEKPEPTATPKPSTKAADTRTAASDDTFPHVTTTEKEVIFEQLQKLFLPAPVSAGHLEALLLEYLRFISIKIGKPHVTYQPCDDVDKLWHAHIICTRQYHAFCSRCNSGIYIHHSPDRNNNVTAYRNTVKEYVKRFGKEPNPVFWSTAGVETSSPAASTLASRAKAEGSGQGEVFVVKIPPVDITLEDLETVVEPNSVDCNREEKVSICETNAMQKLKLLFNISDIKYKEEPKGVFRYVGEQATSGPGCQSNAIFFCHNCRHIWEFGFCERDSSCLKCETVGAMTPVSRGGKTPDNHVTIDYIVRCFGCA